MRIHNTTNLRASSRNFCDLSGRTVRLGRRLGGGGEAEVFAVDGDDSLVAKVYKLATAHREQKLRAMIENPPADPTLAAGHRSICWPETVIYDDKGGFAGFLMSRIDFTTSKPLLVFYNPGSRQRISVDITWQYLVRAAMNVCSVVEAIHSQGHIIGDANESNFLVSNSALVTLVDCDSVQVRDKSTGLRFRCPVGKGEFTPPELQGQDFGKVDREAEHDYFALGVTIFLLLMEGVHPFMGSWQGFGNAPSLEENIKEGYFPYVTSWPLRPSPVAPPFEILPPDIRSLFERCFSTGHRLPEARPNASEWLLALRQLDGALQICRSNGHHVFSGHLGPCPWCERTARFNGFDPFPLHATPPLKSRTAGALPPGAPGFSAPRHPPQRPKRRTFRSELSFALWVLVAGLAAGAAMLFVFTSPSVLTVGQNLWTRIGYGIAVSDVKPEEPQAAPAADATSPSAVQFQRLVLCQGVDRAGTPIAEAARFNEDDVRAKGLTVYVRYSSAVPGKTAVQVKWSSPGFSGSSQLYRLPGASAAFTVPLGQSFPPGSYRFSLIADGVATQTAKITIDRSAVRPNTIPAPLSAEPNLIVNSSGLDAVPPVREPTPSAQAAPKPQKVVYSAKHKHRLGSCDGVLTLAPDAITFESREHPLRFAISDVRLDGDGITDSSGKNWHFSIKDIDTKLVFEQWKNGALFR